MATLTQLASRYRWELMLIVGIPFIERTIWWLLPHILGNFDMTFDIWSLPPFLRPFLNVSLILLALFYFQVRRMGRTILSLLWAYAFVSEAVNIVASPYTYLSDPGQIREFSQSWWARWEVSVGWWSIDVAYLQSILLTILVLVWFARQASKISFGHALVLIGLATPGYVSSMIMSSLVFARFEDRAVAWDIAAFALLFTLFAIWVLSRLDLPREKHEADIERWIGSLNIPVVSVPLRRLAIRILPRFDPARGIGKELLVALFVLHFLPQVHLELRSWFIYGFDSALPIAIRVGTIAFIPLWIVLVILLAYVVRVRQPPERPGTIEPKTKPPKPFLCPSYSSPEEPPTS